MQDKEIFEQIWAYRGKNPAIDMALRAFEKAEQALRVVEAAYPKKIYNVVSTSTNMGGTYEQWDYSAFAATTTRSNS